MKYTDGIVFDLEATCEDRNICSNFDNECIEIGAVKIINGVIVDEFQTFIRPRYSELTKFCTNLTSIRFSDLKGAPYFEDAIELFETFCDGLPLLSWGYYDRLQLEKDCRRYNLPCGWLTNHRSLKHEYADLVSSVVNLDLSNGKTYNRKFLNKVKRGNWGMESALIREGLKLDGTHHRGIDDAKNISKIYLKVSQ